MSDRPRISNNTVSLANSASGFSPEINNCLECCEDQRNAILAISQEADATSTQNIVFQRFCKIYLYVNSAMQGSIHTIGYYYKLLRRLSRNQQNEFRNDLYQMQKNMVQTITACEAANNETLHAIRESISRDPNLHNDQISIQCVEIMQQGLNGQMPLSINAETSRERSDTLNSVQLSLSVLEERAQNSRENGFLKNILKIFRIGLQMIQNLLKVVTACCSSTF